MADASLETAAHRANVSASVWWFSTGGFENAKTSSRRNNTTAGVDPLWKDDPEVKHFVAFMDKWFPEGNKATT